MNDFLDKLANIIVCLVMAVTFAGVASAVAFLTWATNGIFIAAIAGFGLFIWALHRCERNNL